MASRTDDDRSRGECCCAARFSQPDRPPSRFALVSALLSSALTIAIPSRGEPQELRTESAFPYRHRITLYDREGAAIDPRRRGAAPYSPRRTCGKCHAVGRVAAGDHFTGIASGNASGSHEPAVFVDAASETALPLAAARAAPGSGGGEADRWDPVAFGLSPAEWLLHFGAHRPGSPPGGLTDGPALDPELVGERELDCLLCHDDARRHDPAEVERQLERLNLGWVATAAAGFGVVRGAARDLPEDFDPLDDPDPDRPTAALPVVRYRKSLFDDDDRIALAIAGAPGDDACLFCHDSHLAEGDDGAAPHAGNRHADADVHRRAGLTCAQCHPHGMDHDVGRDAQRPTTSCRGCHEAGHLGAPRPQHRGLPGNHLEVLACTACHSGVRPSGVHATTGPVRVHTAGLHRLGLPRRDRAPSDLPAVVEPVFQRRARDGRLAPHRMLWPSFWAARSGDRDGAWTPIPWAVVSRALAALAPSSAASSGADTERRLDDETVPATAPERAETRRRALQGRLAALLGAPVAQVRGGRLHEWDGEHWRRSVPPAAAPVAWPIAHRVRPAADALGAGGCADCHGPRGAIFTGEVGPPGEGAPPIAASELAEVDPRLARAWRALMPARLPVEATCWAACALIAALIAVHGASALRGLSARAGAAEETAPSESERRS